MNNPNQLAGAKLTLEINIGGLPHTVCVVHKKGVCIGPVYMCVCVCVCACACMCVGVRARV